MEILFAPSAKFVVRCALGGKRSRPNSRRRAWGEKPAHWSGARVGAQLLQHEPRRGRRQQRVPDRVGVHGVLPSLREQVADGHRRPREPVDQLVDVQHVRLQRMRGS